ncbi:MAG: PEGA domain-containing protein [Calditrichae bacterium]|nr:PEGA domain-containing protein [Calditrichia bacterium]
MGLGFFGCTTKDGKSPSFDVKPGELLVTATEEDTLNFDARVFVDYKDTGQNTPATLSQISQGRHVVHIFVSGYSVSPESSVVNIEEGKEAAVEFQINKTSSSGNLEISTNPDSALILVDKLPMGRSPLSLSGIQTGNHHVKIIKGGYTAIRQTVEVSSEQPTQLQKNLSPNRLVLVEHFSNTDCAPCPTADAIVENVLHDFGAEVVAGLSYHPNFPGPEDPLFHAAENENLARLNYYSLFAVPFVFVDGSVGIFGNFEQQLRQTIDEHATTPPPAALDIWEFLENHQAHTEISGRIRVEAFQDLPANTVLRIALMEEEITYATAPGTNGQSEFYEVMRSFYPDAEGSPISLSQGQYQFVEFDFERNAEWGEDLQIVAFLQNNANKEVLQAVWSIIP